MAEPSMSDLVRRIEALEAAVRPQGKGAPIPQPRYPDTELMGEKTYLSNATADTEDAVSHGLNRVPAGFHMTKIDKAGVVYASNKPWTAQKAYLKCSAAAANVSLLFY